MAGAERSMCKAEQSREKTVITTPKMLVYKVKTIVEAGVEGPGN